MADGRYSQASACAHCRREAGEGVKLSQCSRCCGPSYCGRSCQEGAWKGGHKGECFSMAKELFSSIASEKGGMKDLDKLLGELMEAAGQEEGRDLSPEERQLVKTLLLVSRTLAAKVPSFENLYPYLMCAIIMGSLAGKKLGTGEEELAGSDAWREATFKELRGALDKYRDVVTAYAPNMLIIINFASAKVLRRLGRFQEAMALARQELPAIEAMPWEMGYARLIVDYYRQLAAWVLEGDSPERNLDRQDWLCHNKESVKQSMEAETMLKKGLERAEKEPSIDRGTVRHVRSLLTYLLGRRKAHREAYPYSRRAFETAPPEELANAACNHATAAHMLGRYSEAEEVLRYALTKLGKTDNTKDKDAAKLRLQLANLSCRSGRLEEALLHVTYARAVYQNDGHIEGSEEFLQELRVWTTTADILEKMGRLDEAIACDETVRRLKSNTVFLGAGLRQLKKAIRDGNNEEARAIALTTLYELASYRDWEIISALPDEDHTTALEVIAEFFEDHGNDPVGPDVGAAIRADVAESRAIRQALQDALLVETREEALAARRRRDAENDWLDVAAGSRAGKKGRSQGKKGKHGPKKTDKAKGKHKNRTRLSPAKETATSDTATAAEQQEEEEGGAKAGGAEGSEHGPAEPAEGGPAEEEEGPEECAVCLLGLDEDEEDAGVLLVCGHRFHGPCVDLWVGNCSSKGLQATCPMCRTEIKY